RTSSSPAAGSGTGRRTARSGRVAIGPGVATSHASIVPLVTGPLSNGRPGRVRTRTQHPPRRGLAEGPSPRAPADLGAGPAAVAGCRGGGTAGGGGPRTARAAGLSVTAGCYPHDAAAVPWPPRAERPVRPGRTSGVDDRPGAGPAADRDRSGEWTRADVRGGARGRGHGRLVERDRQARARPGRHSTGVPRGGYAGGLVRSAGGPGSSCPTGRSWGRGIPR